MNTKLTKNILQTIGGILVLIILMCAGMFLYAQRDLKRFKESLRKLPEVSPMTISQTGKEVNTPTEEATFAEIAAPKPLTPHHIEPKSSKELGMEVPSLETLDSLIDELSLSEVETLEEVIAEENLEKDKVTQVDESQADIGRSGAASLISVLESGNIDIGTGNPEDVATVVEIIKRSAKGPIAVDDLITMMEAWLRIQPDTPHAQSMVNESRNSVMKALSRLRAIREESLQSGKETKRIFRIY